MKIERILAGIDFGPSAEMVAAYASYFAGLAGASLHLLYVLDFLVTPPQYLSPYIEKEREVAGKKFEDLKSRLAATGTEVETEVVIGRLHESFSTSVKRLRSDMLVLGFIPHMLRRSSSEKLIKGLRSLMLVVRGERADDAAIGSVKVGKILCPVDFSDQSRVALHTAREMKDMLSADLEVLSVIPDHAVKKIVKTEDDAEKALEVLRRTSHDEMKKLLSGLRLENQGVVTEGEPAGTIVTYAQDRETDLIIMGARGLGLVREILIGSVTDAVLKSSPCPVLVVH
jgi:nucleotide-binding universal stress UspA family protein